MGWGVGGGSLTHTGFSKNVCERVFVVKPTLSPKRTGERAGAETEGRA